MNILIVDDEPYMLEQLEFMIKPMCPMWDIYTASDSSQALLLSKQVKFQVAFLDIELPGKSGLEIAEALKQQDKDIDIIIVTAYQNFEYAHQSIKIGVSNYLTKPIIESELKEIIQSISQDGRYMEYSRIVLKALDIIHEKYSDRINLPSVSKKIHVNSSYLSRRFSGEIGLPFSEYLTNYRLERAKTLLLTHMDYSISEIAELTGFNSLHYFSTIFRKKEKITPKQYRELGK